MGVILYALKDEPPKITAVKWLGRTGKNGVLPEIAEMFIQEPPPQQNIEVFIS